ncbi:MAG: hypothetical protein A2X86_18400 [Bdellovibrionales bacterium GWA2_49_15]|nr:MAG: hypothetical protein A2X86_18400 [Bdellovibrionales bacterium GWA2_49_15]HAZ11696.1 hypothetical protein [Bdellovibrionales bacterium]
MRTYGLKNEEFQEIEKKISQFFGDLPDAKIFLFGSRATGKHKLFSDIDLAVKSKSKELGKRISLFKVACEESNLPYKMDITSWDELYAPYLPSIRREKIEIWGPHTRPLHPWRVCPYGQHWVVRHPRYPIGRQMQDVDGHCRKNPSGKDRLTGEEVDLISLNSSFINTQPLPLPYSGNERIIEPNAYDILIAGWCRYWNDIFTPDLPIEVNFIKALIESESRFNPLAIAKNKKTIGPARGLVQITEQTLKILKDRKGEIKDHYIDFAKEELFTPSKNLCAAIRWLFRKREILQKRLQRSPTWVETIVEYKGLGPDLKKNGHRSLKVMNDFLSIYQRYR